MEADGPSAMSAAHFVHVATTDWADRGRRRTSGRRGAEEGRQSFYGREWELKSLDFEKE